MQSLTEDRMPEVLAADRAVIYKHSPACWSGAMAMRQMRRFIERHPDTPVWMVDVIAQRPLSRAIAERCAIRHESPQVILICRGTPAWHDSHFGVQADALARQLAQTECGTAIEEGVS